jgi:hypothetical protein
MEIMAMIPQRHCAWTGDRIEQYSRETLPEEDAARLEEHLFVCEACQDRLAEEDAYSHAMRFAALQLCRRPQKADRYRQGWLFRPLAFLAMLVLLAVAGWHWIRPAGPVPPLAVKLQALRGPEPDAKAPSGRPLSLHADLSDLVAAGSYPLELVDREGRAMWRGSTARTTIPPLRPGLYFLRVYSAAGKLLREYGLEIESR